MHRRALVLGAILVAMLALGFRGGTLGAQQLPAATEVKIFVPFTPGGELNPSLRVRGTETVPRCQAGAITTTRPDAWRCITADPCFVPQFAADQMTLACVTAPWSGEVMLLTVQTPLRSSEECMMPPLCRQQLNLDRAPWALELANGARCTLFTGTIPSLAGIGLTYGCADPTGTAGGATRGVVDRSQPVWRIFFLPEGGYVMEQVDVLVAWY